MVKSRADTDMSYNYVKWLVIALAGIAIILVIVPYIHYFSGDISRDQRVWANFGDYIGGVLNPLLGFITIIVLIITLGISFRTLDMTKEELKQSREIAKEQVAHFKNESLKSELLDVIKEVDAEIQKVFERKADFSADGNNFGYYFSYSATSTSMDEIPIHGKFNFSTNDRVTLCDLCELLQKMEGYLNQYDKTFDPSPRTYHFKSKYLTLYSRLTDKTYLVKDGFEAFQNTGYAWFAPDKRL